MILTDILLIAVLIVFSAFFSASETTYSTVNKLRLSNLAEETGKGAARLADIIAGKTEEMLSSVLIGNNLVNIAASSIATLMFASLISDAAVAGVTATAVMTVLLLVFGEITPKIVAKRRSLQLALMFAYPLRVITLIFRPITLLFQPLVRGLSRLWKPSPEEIAVTEEDISDIIEAVEEEGVIDEDKSDLLQSALDFSSTTVEELLTPRINVVFLDIDDGMDEAMNIALTSRYSRIPVYRETRDNILGILNINNFMKEVLVKGKDNVTIEECLMPVISIHKTMKLPDALALFREKKMHMTIVIDEYGGTMGIVTLEDILEEIVGDIWDENDIIRAEYVKTGDNSYDVSGLANVYDFLAEIGVDDRDFTSEYVTMGGWAVEMLESAPHVGDSFIYENLYLIVKEMEDNCVTRLSVIVTEKAEE